MDRTTTNTKPEELPILHYSRPKGYLSGLRPSIMMGMVREVADVDIWKGAGLAMKGRRNFAEWCHMVAPEWCIVKNRTTVIKEALSWCKHTSATRNFDDVKKQWQPRLTEQLRKIKEEYWMTQSASEAIFDILDDGGITENATTEIKEKMALCMIFAIWKERKVPIENYDTDSLEEQIRLFAQYIEKGQWESESTDYERFSPWLAVHWILTHKNISPLTLETIHNDNLKDKVKILTNDLTLKKKNYFDNDKRKSENAFILNQLKAELPPDPVEYEKEVNGHDPELQNLVYNIHGVEYWGVCLDRIHLVNSTVNSVLGKAIQAAKKDMEKIARDKLGQEMIEHPQDYARQKLEHAERVLIKTGISQISESLQDELYKVFSPAHMAEGAAPLALSILIRSEMLKLSAEYLPHQLNFMMPQIINSISPLLLASAFRVTQGAIKALQQLQKQTVAEPQVGTV
jgi:hypothetical protein